jgi:hypothetical protein
VNTIASDVITVAPNGPQVATHRGVRSPMISSAHAALSDAHWIASRPTSSKPGGREQGSLSPRRHSGRQRSDGKSGLLPGGPVLAHLVGIGPTTTPRDAGRPPARPR